MTLEDLIIENDYTKQLPQYIRQYRNFFKFMKMLSNYILKSVEYANNILKFLDFADKDSKGDVLIKVARKVDVLYDKAYLEETDKDKYYDALKTGIYGMQSKRLSNGTLYELQNNLSKTIPGITTLRIFDNMNMSVNIEIVGKLEKLDSAVIENYIIPKVTGVRFDVQYIPYNEDLFALDKSEDVLDEQGNKLYGLYGWDKGKWAPKA